MKEAIKHAVVKTECGMILLGKCHADCFYIGQNLSLKMSKKADDQGFFTNKGRYVDRKKAAVIAKRAGQLKKDDRRKVTYLLSEDIWYQTDRFIYCPMRGYVEILK